VNPDEINKVLAEADCLYSQADVEKQLERVAQAITADHADKLPIVLCVMTGAIIPAGHLLTRLHFPLEVDYIHATRYRGDTRGGEIHWEMEPATELRNRDVIIVDDILDEGYTLASIVEYCQQAGAANISTMVLVEKQHERKHGIQADYVGLKIEDRYVFGYGMDYKGYLRNIAGIYAVKGM